MNTKSVNLPQVFPICSYIPGITFMISSLPTISFASRSTLPSYSKLWSAPILSHNFGYLPHTFIQGNTIAFINCRSPSVDENTSIPEDRPKGSCILVSLTSLMSSLDHLRGVLSASHDGCVSRAQLQLHHRTVEIHTGYWSLQYLVEDLGCHLTLAHW